MAVLLTGALVSRGLIGLALGCVVIAEIAGANMSSWPVEKNIFLNMDVEKKRRQYKGNSFLTLQEVPPWVEEVSRQSPSLDSDVNIFKAGGMVLDASLNVILAHKVSLWNGDITQFEVDAIVNAANTRLLGGAGVDGAIHRAAGAYLLEECESIRGCPTGEARISGGYQLPAKYVIHTVGPTNKSAELLKNCYRSCFALQRANELKTIVFPCIGTGVYNFPNIEAAHIACSTSREFLEEDAKEHGGSVERIIFCTFEPKDFKIYQSVIQLYFPHK
ncbi:macro domain-containing protein CT2219-like [Arctopsyche grandis]|uniref:macro domain-containing protein CT2219-like n=1 Tax=Arctopsyche grandis TaxID=121162 RepID=UPI00406D6616